MALRKNFLIGLVCFLLTLLLSSSLSASVLVDVNWLKDHQQDVKIIGVYKRPTSFFKGHIPNSLPVDRKVELNNLYAYPPVAFPDETQFTSLMNKLGIKNDSMVVIYDDSYQFASRLFVIMELYGHDLDRLKILDGGLSAWKAAGGEVIEGRVDFVNGDGYLAKPRQKDLTVLKGDILKNITCSSDNNYKLLDVRTEAEWLGERVRSIRTGNIPKALHISGVDAFMDKDTHKFIVSDEIRKMLSEKGVTKDKTIYLYCYGGSRTPHAYVYLKHLLGYPDVRVYENGWLEWAISTALPVANEKWIFAKKEEGK